MSAITAKASRKMKKYAVLTREPRCFLGSFDFSWEQRKVSELFRVTRGYVLAATQTETTKTDEKPYPVYSSQTKDKGLMGYYKDYLYEDAITWTTDGANAGTVNYRAGKFYCTNVCGVLLSNEVKANQMIAEALNSVAKGYVSYVGNPKLMNNVMADIVIQIPTQAEEREQLSSFFAKLDNLITLHQRKCANLCSPSQVVFSLLFATSTFSWEQRKLGDIADIVGGGTPSTGNQSYWDGDIDWYAPAEIADQIYVNSSQKKITGLGYENSSAKMLPPGTVLFTSRAGIGKTAILTRKGCTNQGFQSIVPHRGELDSYFIFSRTGELKRYGELVGAGSTFVEVSGKQMAVMELMMPPTMREQQTIGGFFQQLDHLITLHQRECISFTGRADRLILTANKKRTTSSWEQRKAKEICSIGTGKSNTQDQVDDGKYPFYIRSDVPVRSNKYLYDCEAVITIGDGNIGKVFHYVNGKFDLHQRCYKMTDFKDIWGKYFFYYFSTKFYDRAMKMTAKATVDSVRLEMISEMDIKKPPQISEQKQIAEFFANLDNLITLHQRKPFLMKWRTSDANRNQTNRLVL